MKHVTKGAAPASLESWKTTATPEWTPSYAELPQEEKRNLHNALLAEQGGVCCYCGRRIAADDSHIEHFRPQARHPDMALAYENLHASCIRLTKPNEPLHCGHAKGGEFDETLHMSPLDPDSEAQFSYALNGEAIATDPVNKKVPYMTGLLKLNQASLLNRRRDAINRAFDADFLVDASEVDMTRLRDAFRTPDAQGHARDFGHVVARFAEQRLADGASTRK